jgi:hypothetical protein
VCGACRRREKKNLDMQADWRFALIETKKRKTQSESDEEDDYPEREEDTNLFFRGVTTRSEFSSAEVFYDLSLISVNEETKPFLSLVENFMSTLPTKAQIEISYTETLIKLPDGSEGYRKETVPVKIVYVSKVKAQFTFFSRMDSSFLPSNPLLCAS